MTLKDIHSAVEELQWSAFSERASALPVKASVDGGMPGADRPHRSPSKIVLSSDGQAIAELHLVPGRKVVGRTPDNDLQIDSKFISRHHAQIITSGSTSVLEDLNSTNGVYVRAKRVRRRMLNDGDVVQIGQHEIMYFDERLSRTRI